MSNKKLPKNLQDPHPASPNKLSPEDWAAIEYFLKQKAIDLYKEAFSIDEFCRRYGIGRSLVYDQINLGYLTARKAPGSDRTWKPPKTSRFRRVCDSISQVCAGGRRCAVRRDFSMLTSG